MKTPKNAKVVKLEDAVTFAPFDAAEYLDNEEVIAAYLTEAAAEGDGQLFLTALADIARARSMTKLAKDSGLGRESLYKSLRVGAKPRFDTVAVIMHAMGLRLAVVPLKSVYHKKKSGAVEKIIYTGKIAKKTPRVSHRTSKAAAAPAKRA